MAKQDSKEQIRKAFLSHSADAVTLVSALQSKQHNLSQSCFSLYKRSKNDDELTNLSWLQSTSLINNIPTVFGASNHMHSVHNRSIGVNKRHPNGHFRSKSAPSTTTTSLRTHALTTSSHKRTSLGSHNHTGSSNSSTNTNHHANDGSNDTNNKPPYSFPSLIFMAIENSPSKMLPVKDIYTWVLEHFPYFMNAPTGWKNSVRHNLSLNKCFKKVEREKGQATGKGSLWCVDPEYRPNLLQTLKKTSYMTFKRETGNASSPCDEAKPCLLKAVEAEAAATMCTFVSTSDSSTDSHAEKSSNKGEHEVPNTADNREEQRADTPVSDNNFAVGLMSLAAAGAIVNKPEKRASSAGSTNSDKFDKVEKTENLSEIDDGYDESEILNESINIDNDDTKSNGLGDSGYVEDSADNELVLTKNTHPQKKKLKISQESTEMDSYAGAGALLDLASSAPKPLKV